MTALSKKHCEYYMNPYEGGSDPISRQAAKKAHPDVGGSEDKMAALNEAYEVLSDPGRSSHPIAMI